MNYLYRVVSIIICSHLFTSTVSSGPLCINTENTAIRISASTRAPKLWESSKFTPLIQIARSKDATGWYQVKDFDGEKGWVHTQLVSRNFRCGLIKVTKPEIKMKLTLGEKTPQPIHLPKYTAFKIRVQKWGWVQIELASGRIFWIQKSETWIP